MMLNLSCRDKKRDIFTFFHEIGPEELHYHTSAASPVKLVHTRSRKLRDTSVTCALQIIVTLNGGCRGVDPPLSRKTGGAVTTL